MEKIQEMLPGAAMAGLGTVLCALGYKTVCFYTLRAGVCVFAAAGCIGGALVGSMPLAAVLLVGGALLGYLLDDVLFHVFIGLMAALGGAAIGVILSILTHYSNPKILCAVAACGCAVIALMNARLITIAWTSLVGAAMATLGLVTAVFRQPGLSIDALAPHQWMIGIVFVALTAAGAIFQERTTREPAPAPKPMPSPKPLKGAA